MEDDWRAPIVFQMVPSKNYSEIKTRWQQMKEKDVAKFVQELIVFANELKHEQISQARGKGPSPMDVDYANRDANGEEERYTAEEWEAFYREDEAPVDWMGKGWRPQGKGGGKKGKKGKGGKATPGKGQDSGCHWCGKLGHVKAECRDFDKWKKDKDEERKKKGLPPFKARGVSNLEPEGPQPAGEGDDYTGFDLDAGALDLGADAVDVEICGNADDDDDDGDYIQILKNPKRECSHGACHASCHDAAVRRRIKIHNAFEDLDSDGEDDDSVPGPSVDVLEKYFEDDIVSQQDPWKQWPSRGPSSIAEKSESLVEMITRQRKELEEKAQASEKQSSLKATMKIANEAQASPPGLGTVSKVSERSTEPSESVLKRCESKPQNVAVSMGTQTEVHLEHQIKSITWIPVVETIEPVHDIDDDFFVESEEKCELVDKIDSKECGKGMIALENRETISTVDDVDMLEIVRSKLGGKEESKDLGISETQKMESQGNMGFEIGTIMTWFMMVMGFVCAVNREIVEDPDVCPLECKSDTDREHTESNRASYRAINRFSKPICKECNSCPADNNRSLGAIHPSERAKPRTLAANGVRAKLKLKRGITLDSGSHHNVMPRRLVNQRKIRPSAGSKAGLHYKAANNGRIPNEGEVDFEFETMEGDKESWLFQIAQVNKALGAIADRVDNNYRVIFDKNMATGYDASYILNKSNNKVTKSTRIGNIWVIEAIVYAEDVGEASFVRR